MKQVNKTAYRPALLSALCILTFIGSTIGFLGHFLASVFFEQATDIIITYSSWHTTESISPFYFTPLMVMFALSLIAAIRMWKLHRDGYYLYLISQLVILFIPVLWNTWNEFSAINAIFTTVFVVGYSINLKWLK